jgi:hypothetical protein
MSTRSQHQDLKALKNQSLERQAVMIGAPSVIEDIALKWEAEPRKDLAKIEDVDSGP